LFTGRKPDLDTMRDILRKALSPLNYKDEDEPTDEEEREKWKVRIN
jgi:hypothetical protein